MWSALWLVVLFVGLHGWTCLAATVQVPCCSFAPLQAYIANASDGTVFALGPGTFTGCRMFDSSLHPMVLNHSFTYIGDPAGTTIDCAFASGLEVMRLDATLATTVLPQVVLTMRDITIIRAANYWLDAINFYNSPAATLHVVIRNVTVRDFLQTATVRWVGNGNLTVTDSVFRNITNAVNSGTNGGAMYIQTSGRVLFQNALFDSCGAGCHGGAIFTEPAKTGNATVEFYNSTFRANTAGVVACCTGGALLLSGNNMRYTIDGCLFQGNNAWANSGAIWLGGTSNTISIRNTTFLANTAQQHSGPPAPGGAIVIDTTLGVNLTISGSQFLRNFATSNGGAIYVLSTTTNIPQTVLITSTNFTGNTGTVGGAVSMGGWRTRHSITSCSFQNNVASTAGGAIYTEGSYNSYSLASSTLVNNTGGTGGAYYAQATASSYTILSTQFLCNNASNSAAFGGAFGATSPNNTYYFANSTFLSNVGAQAQGAAIGFHYGVTLSPITITGCTFYQNMGVGNGGAITMTGCSTTATQGFVAPIPFVLSNSSFVGSVGLGRGIVLSGKGVDYLVDGCYFSGNSISAGVGGGIVHFGTGNNLVVRNSQFLSNTAPNGGGIGMCGTTLLFTVDNCVFYGSVGNANGGGAVHLHTPMSMTITNSTFDHNTGGSGANGGGAVSTLGPATTTTIDNCLFKYNYSPVDGGAVYSPTGVALSISNSVFLKNTALGNGGGFYGAGVTSLTNVMFLSNNGTFSGGAIYQVSGSISATPDCFFQANNLTGGAYPMEATLGALGCSQVPSPAPFTPFPYQTSGCSGLVGVPCMVECPALMVSTTTINNIEAITCPSAGAMLTNIVCVPEAVVRTQWIANNYSAATTPNYGTRGVWSPSNKISVRSTSVVVHSALFPDWALIICGSGKNEQGTATLSETWLVDTSDFGQPKFTWVAGSKYTSGSANHTGIDARIFPLAWIDQSTAYVYGGAFNGVHSDMWTLDMNNFAQDWQLLVSVGYPYGTIDQPPVYGPRGVFSPFFQMGARFRGAVFQMPRVLPHVAVFYGGASDVCLTTKADMWMFNCSTMLWAYVGGPTIAGNVFPSYGVKGVVSPSNWPGSRQLPGVWVWNDKVYLFGGITQQGSDFAYYNDLWSATYDAATSTFTWMWIDGPKHVASFDYDPMGVQSPLYQFCPGCVPHGVLYMQFAFSPELAAGGLSEGIVYGGYWGSNAFGDVWALRPGIGGARLSGHQSAATTDAFGTPFTFNSSYVFGSPGPRQNGMIWPDHSRPGEFYVFGGYKGDCTLAAPALYRMSVISAITVNATLPICLINVLQPASLKLVFWQGNVSIPSISTSRVSASVSAGTVTVLSPLVNGVVSLNFTISTTISYYQIVTATLTVNDHLTVSFPVNISCPNHCASCTGTSVSVSCQACAGNNTFGLRYVPSLGRCLCNTSANLGLSPAGDVCMDCSPASGNYLDSNANCWPCQSIVGCLNTTCTSPSDARCAQCAAGRFRINVGSTDICAPCSGACGVGYFVDTPCGAANDRSCRSCSSCGTGTYQALACLNQSIYQDTICEPCTSIAGCIFGLSCSAPNVSQCFGCEVYRFLYRSPHASDECRPCSNCGLGTYLVDTCNANADTRCRNCDVGCANCSDAGVTRDTCSACDESAGYGWNLANTTCVNTCPVGYYMGAADPVSGTPRRCMPCSTGCASCTATGLMLGATGGCSVCKESLGYLISGDGSECVTECGLGYYPNTTIAGMHYCHTCEGATCQSGQYRECSDPLHSTCQDCTSGCGTCSGPGLSLLDYCLSCAPGFAPSDDGSTCAPCAANCSLCTTSPHACSVCADSYAGPPNCEPVCDSPGCISCQTPGACLLCQPTFVGGDCKKCSDKAQVGTSYPDCVAARQTDVTSTGASMGLLAALCILVTVIALGKPLPVFYSGEQVIRAPSQDIPLSVDFVLSSKRLQLTLTPEAPIVEATVEGVGLIPGSCRMTQEDEKSPYTLTMSMTQKQTVAFLSRDMRVEVKLEAGSGRVTARHVLAIPLRMTAANLLAIFTIVLDFIQLSSFGFGSSIVWWHSDPVPSSLHYTLIQLPATENLWFVAYWILVSLALLWILLVAFLKSGADRALAKYGVFKTISGPIYGFLMPLVGQTLYLPIISTMLGALACSRPVTDPTGSFVANFDESLICWSGGHWLYVVVSSIILLVYYPLAVYTSPLWQTINTRLDVRYFPAFLIVSGQMKFVLSLTAQLFAKVPFLLSILLIILPLPVVVLTLSRPPSVIGALRWPIAASYASVTWSGIASIVALLYPNVWYTSIILYTGWALLLIVSLIAASRRPSHEDANKKDAGGADALRRVLAGEGGESEEQKHVTSVAFDGGEAEEDNAPGMKEDVVGMPPEYETEPVPEGGDA